MNTEIQAINNFVDKLEERSAKLKKLSLDDWLTMSKIESLPEQGYYVYIIFAPNATKVDSIISGLNNCKSNCNKCKGEVIKKAFPKINRHRQENKDNCVYVGSSESLKTRIKQHFDDNCTALTYALHIKCYYKEDDLIVKYININDRDLMQDVEDALWDYYKPVLGKRGQK